MKKLFFLFSIALLVIITSFIFIGQKPKLDTKKVATSIFVTYSLAQQVAKGGDVEIVNILPAGVSPHAFQPTAQDQLRLSSVDKVFVIGHELDDWIVKSATSANQQAEIIPLDKNIKLLKFKEDHQEEANHTEEEHEHGEFDPHYWLSINNAKLIAEAIKQELIKLDPKNEPKYLANYTDLTKSLDKLKAESLDKLKPFKDKKIITFHGAFTYFAEEFGIDIVATIEEFPGQTPSPAYIASVGQKIKQYNVKILFKEPEFPEAIVASLAKDYGAIVKTLDPIASASNKIDQTYQDAMRYNINVIIESLKNK